MRELQKKINGVQNLDRETRKRGMNQKGEMFTLTALALTGVIALMAGMLFSPLKSAFGFGKDGQKTKQSYVSKTESQPIIVKGADGQSYWLQKTTTTTSTNDESEQSKMSLWQKLMVLPKLWLFLMILGIFCAPVAAFMTFINGKLKTAAKQIVSGVENGIAQISTTSPESKQKLLDAMSKKYDGATKLLVNKIKAEL